MSDEIKVAVVTGAASGIGRATAARLAQPDVRLVLVDRSESVMEVADELGGDGTKADGLVADLADVGGVSSLTTSIDDLAGGCDILVNCAGVHPKKPDGNKFPIPEITLDQWESVVAINLTSPFLLSSWALEHMKARQWGRIINVASRAGRTYLAVAGAHYAATKAGLIGFTRVLAGEGGPFNVTANCVAPGRVKTPLSDQGDGRLHKGFADSVPLGRIGRPDEIAAAIAFLASEDASFITGSVIDANGGAFG
jgi:3-oxoacyl-[acyl-carrier protein] reductase